MNRGGDPEPRVKIGIIGDLHGAFDEADARYFNESDYDLLLFTGDLGSGTQHNGLAIARHVARLSKPTLVVAGNNDAPFAHEIAAEFKYHARLQALMRAPSEGFDRANIVSLCGYDLRTYSFRGYSFSVLIGRPYARGGDELFGSESLSERYGVKSAEDSLARLRELVSAAPTRDVVWLAHNGPKGLGASGTDIWGADFKNEGGDWGDTDLALAIEDSERSLRVVAVVAGHMHRPPPTRGNHRSRTAVQKKGNAVYVNAAVVPRIFSGPKGSRRHHMALEICANAPAQVRDVWVDED